MMEQVEEQEAFLGPYWYLTARRMEESQNGFGIGEPRSVMTTPHDHRGFVNGTGIIQQQLLYQWKVITTTHIHYQQ